jgi:hypothetical protein
MEEILIIGGLLLIVFLWFALSGATVNINNQPATSYLPNVSMNVSLCDACAKQCDLVARGK